MEADSGRLSTSRQFNSPPPNPNTEELLPNILACYDAIVFAVHKVSSKKLNAVMAPRQALNDIIAVWRVENILNFDEPLYNFEKVYICVPLSEKNDEDHLPLKDYTLR